MTNSRQGVHKSAGKSVLYECTADYDQNCLFLKGTSRESTIIYCMRLKMTQNEGKKMQSLYVRTLL